ncbi:MAG TPA: 3'-5' exonuclease, partial [Saprospiraceae bacterium]|nr:3'-5' exonuclease [Saprospiraceae bacterium]
PDIPQEQVVLEAAIPAPPPQAAEGLSHPSGGAGAALLHWHFLSSLDERKVPGSPWLENCIADQIKVMLERETLIFNKKRTVAYPLRPCDIAVLCRNNHDCAKMAEALHRSGLKAAISRAGLSETSEARLVLACLKCLITPSDALSVAEIALLSGQKSLEEIVEERLAALSGDGATAPAADALRERLMALRPRTADLSASEILNLLMDELDLRRISVGMGNAAQRLDNLDQLRRLALEYESACNRLHTAASLGGFLLWLNDLSARSGDRQGAGESEDAVKVLTYHRSKGLEYPVAICHNLAQKLREQIWGVNLVSELEEPDLDNILGNRWMRFWVNPYADQLQGTPLAERLKETEAWAAATRTALQEEARLLYVGITRARDYLVFPTTAKPTLWLDRVFNHGDEGIPTLDPHSDETPFYHDGLPLCCDLERIYKPADFPEAVTPPGESLPFHAERLGRRAIPHAPLWVDVYHSDPPPGFETEPGEPRPFAPWLEFRGEYPPALGKALQALLGVLEPGLPAEESLLLARHQLRLHQLGEVLSAEALLRHADAFWAFFQREYGDTVRISPKYLLEATYGEKLRRVRWEADWLVQHERGVAAVVSGGFAEGMKKWRASMKNLSPVLGWALWLLRRAFPDQSVDLWVVFPMEGQLVRG